MDELLASEAEAYVDHFQRLADYSLPIQPVASFYSGTERKLQVFCSSFEGEETRDARLSEIFVLLAICGFDRLIFSTDTFLSESDTEGLLSVSLPLNTSEPIHLLMRPYSRLAQGISFETPTVQTLDYNSDQSLVKIMKTSLELPIVSRKWHLNTGFASWILAHRGHIVTELSYAQT